MPAHPLRSTEVVPSVPSVCEPDPGPGPDGDRSFNDLTGTSWPRRAGWVPSRFGPCAYTRFCREAGAQYIRVDVKKRLPGSIYHINHVNYWHKRFKDGHVKAWPAPAQAETAA